MLPTEVIPPLAVAEAHPELLPEQILDTENMWSLIALACGQRTDSDFPIHDYSEEDYEGMHYYTADFETTVDTEDCRVWAAGICEIGNPDHFEYGNSIDWFLSWCAVNKNNIVYFHNLAFDGTFIMDFILNNGWTWVNEFTPKEPFTFTTVISDLNQVYELKLCFGKNNVTRIQDSLKICPLSIAAMAYAFGLPIKKGHINYEEYRPVGHYLTEEEISYLENDVKIAAMALAHFLDQGLNRLTAGSNALYDFKQTLGGEKGFRKWFPRLDNELDAFLRNAYRGGFTYVNPAIAGWDIGEGLVYDINSSYPSAMYCMNDEVMPYGYPYPFVGEPHLFGDYKLWVAKIRCKFVLRPKHIPCMQLKDNPMFPAHTYVRCSKGTVEITVTSIDWELMKKQYYISNIEWIRGYYFKAETWFFRDYIDHWMNVKIESSKTGNKAMRQIAKLMLNSLYGKFATRTSVVSRQPVIEDGVLNYIDLPPEEKDGIYIPAALFITAYGRRKVITAAQDNYSRFLYADTDSIHLLGTDEPTGSLDIDDYRLGAWKLENRFWQAKYLRAKTYIEYMEGDTRPTVRVAGMPKTCHNQVTIDNFNFGHVYQGKLYTKRVPGGIVLEPGPVEIRK